MLRVLHTRSKCIGCASCMQANDSRWRMSVKDGKSTLVGGIENKGVYKLTTFDDELVSLREAERNCPVRIIKVEVF